MEAAAAVASGLRRARLAPSTRATYQVGQKAWVDFCAEMGSPPLLTGAVPLERQATLLELFVGYLLVTRKVTRASTIQSHLSAVSALHVDSGYPSPTRLTRRAGLLQDLFQGVQKVTGAPHRAPALTVSDLEPFVKHAFSLQSEIDIACAALSVLAATAMLRVHEYIVYHGKQLTTKTLMSSVLDDSATSVADSRTSELVWRARQALRTRDIQFVQDSDGVETMVVRLRTWKFSIAGTEHVNPLKCVKDWPVCAHCCIRRFLKLRELKQASSKEKSKDIPWLAQLSDGSFVLESDVTSFIRRAAQHSGRADWADATPHGLRRGGATQLYHAGLDVTAVREAGRWRSLAGVEPYLVTHTHVYQEMWQKAISDRKTRGATLGTTTAHAF